jgi:hypothetical protein
VTTVPAGTVSAPAITTTGDTNTGIFFPAADTIAFSEGGVESMRINSSGNVGIGETSPTTTLDVKAALGRIKLTSSTGTNNALVLFNNTGGNAYVGLDSSAGSLTAAYALNLYHEGAYPITFSTNNAERARIDSSGNLLVGTTSAVAQITSVSSLASTAAGYFNLNAVSSTTIPAIYLRKYDNNNTTSQIYVAFQYNQGAGASGGIQGNGATGVQLFSSSDARLKENIVELEPQLANIMALKPSKFDFIDGPKDCTGFIAQEMEAVYPDAIGETPDGFKTIGGISIMETRLIKCIQEQQALITQLQADVAALKGASA